MPFFNIIATPGLGTKNNQLEHAETTFGQTHSSINANPLNGNLFLTDFTQSFSEQIAPFNIAYQYNSQSKTPWRLSQAKCIGPIQGQPNEVDSWVTVEESDGHESIYTYDPVRNTYVNTSEHGSSTLTYTSEGQWAGWNPTTGNKESYNQNNQLQTCTDAYGNQLNYSYDDQNRLIAISGSSGRKVVIEYGDHTTHIYSIDGDKKSLVMHYLLDEHNRVKKASIPINEHEFYETHYSYSASSGLLEHVKQSDQTEAHFNYEHHDGQYRLKSLSSGAGEQWTMSYESDRAKLIDPIGNTKEYYTNESGLLHKQCAHEQNQIYKYDSFNRISSILYQDGSAQKFEYDVLGFYSELTDRNGEKTLFKRDPNTALLLCETQVLIEPEGEKHSNTFYIYNTKRELIYSISPIGAVLEYTYDDRGNRISEKTYLEKLYDLSHLTRESEILPNTLNDWCMKQNQQAIKLTEWTYNLNGDRLSETSYANIDEHGKGIDDEYAAHQEYQWNDHGDLLQQKTKLNNQDTSVQTTEYDGLSRPTKETNSLGQVTQHEYRTNQQHSTFIPTGLVTTSSWDASGTVIEKKAQAADCSNISGFIYDAAGRICIIEKLDSGKEYIVHDEHDRVLYRIDSAMRVTKHSYDTNGQLLHQIKYDTPLAQVNESELKKGLWQPDCTGNCSIVSTFYSPSGQLLCSIDTEHYVTKHRYDSLGNRIETIKYATALDLNLNERLSLDDIPDMEESTKDRVHHFFYNAAQQLIGEQLPSGQAISYILNAHGEILNKITTLGALPRIGYWDEGLVLTVPYKKETFILDARGRCLNHIDAEQYSTKKIWDAAGRLVERSRDEESVRCVWNAAGQLLKETHSSGLEINKTYAACGKIASESETDRIAGSAVRSKYLRYNGFGQPTHELNPRVAAKLSALDLTENPNLGEELWQNQSVRHAYTNSGLKISTQDELGNTSYYFYNSAQELCFTISPTGSIKEYTYDALTHKCDSTRKYKLCLADRELKGLTGGTLSKELINQFHSKQSKEDEVERIQYNGKGLVTLKVDPEQFCTRTEYDAFDNIISLQQQIDKDNQLVSNMEYDHADRPLKKIEDVDGANVEQSWMYVDEEHRIIHTDPNQNTTQTFYDKLQRKVRELDALGRETNLVWDSLSRPTQTIDALQQVTAFTYENHGRKVTTTRAQKRSIVEKNAFDEVEMEENADGEVWRTLHDVDGQLKTETDPESNQYHYQYNDAGWLTRVIDALTKATRYTHNKAGEIDAQIEEGVNDERTTVFQRDAQGREVLRTDAKGNVTQTVYDKRGLVLAKIIAPKTLALSTQQGFDGIGNLISEIKGDSQYPQQQKIQIVRDKLGRIYKTIIDPDGLALTTVLMYDAAGNCITRIDPNNHRTWFIYDAANQEQYCIDPMGAVVGKIYDKKGRCIEERHYAQALDLNRAKKFTLDEIEALVVSSIEDKVVYSAFDENDHPIATLDEHGKLTQARYTAQGKKSYEISYATPMTKEEFLAGKPITSPQDRQSAWFYDGAGNEQFAINGEGIVKEQRWNEKGWLIEERTYANPYFDYNKRPSRDALQHPDDRSTHFIHDKFGRVLFEVDGEGYVTEYEYDRGDEPLITRFYPDKIALPNALTLAEIKALLPDKKDIPYIQVKLDEAGRKIEAIDQLKYREQFKLDALDNLREYIDKGGDSWLFGFDAAGRKNEEATPAVEVTSVTAQGKLSKATEKKRIIKKIEYSGDIERVTEAFGTAEARTVECHKNAAGQTTQVVQQGVAVHDKSKKPTEAAVKSFIHIDDYAGLQSNQAKLSIDTTPYQRPEVSKTLSVTTVYNSFQKPIVIVNEAGNLKFNVYQKGRLRYEIDQEGFVTSYEHNVFGNVIKLTRHAEPLAIDLNPFARTGIPVSTVVANLKPTEHDRSVFLDFDRANRPTQTRQDKVFIALPRAHGSAEYGEFSPVKTNAYNAFGEIYEQRELVDPFTDQWNVVRKWFNKAGYQIAEVDGLNYVTLSTIDRDGNSTNITEYANCLRVALDAKSPISNLLAALEPDPILDRLYSNQFNARSDLIKSIQHDVQLYDPELDLSAATQTPLPHKQSLEHVYARNAKGFLVFEQFPNGSSETTLFDARNLPVLKTKRSRQLENGMATPVTTLSYNSFGQPSRITSHKNPYEKDAYLAASEEDQTYLTGYDARGMQVVSVDPEGAMHSQSITETKKIAASWIVVRGWDREAIVIQRLHYATRDYDKRDIEVLHTQSIENGSTVVTATRSNAFGEIIAEGSEDGSYPVYWLRDKTGAVWNTNERGGVPTISLCDARGQETLSLTSRTRSLKDVNNASALKEVMTWDYQDLQRVQLQRDLKGNIERQSLPAFSSLAKDAPEPYPLTEVSSGSLFTEFGPISLSWPNPDIAGLEAEVRVWPKGRLQDAQPLAVKKGTVRSGVDVSKLATDDYDYQIDFYYRDPQSQQRGDLPRYRAEGSAVIFTELRSPTANLLWHQVDDQRLMFYGPLGDVSGIELMQDGVSCGRVSINSTAYADQWIVDLSDKPSGQYAFRFLHGFSLVEEQALKVGVPSAKGSRIDRVATSISQSTLIRMRELNNTVTTSWQNLPPQVNNLYQELTVINASSPIRPDDRVKGAFAIYTPQTINQPLTTNAGGSQTTVSNSFSGEHLSFWRFSSTISKNRLYSIDSNNKQWTVAEWFNPVESSNRFSQQALYIQSGNSLPPVNALRECYSNGSKGKTFALKQWINQSSRSESAYSNNHDVYELVSLASSVPDARCCGQITIHTENRQSKQLLVREIALKQTKISKIQTNFNPPVVGHQLRHALNFHWNLPNDLTNNSVKVKVKLQLFQDSLKRAYGDFYDFEYIIGRSHSTPYNGHLLPMEAMARPYHPAFADFDLNHLTLYVQFDGDWIPILNSNTFTTVRSTQNKPYSMNMELNAGGVTKTVTMTSFDEGDISTFQDSNILLFYPLPSGIHEHSLEYWDTTLPTPDWRRIDSQYTGRAIAAPSDNIRAGVYKYRLSAKNANGQAIDLSSLAGLAENGYSVGQFTVTHGGTLTTTKTSLPVKEVVRPAREQLLDRWGNVISSTNAIRDVTRITYNGRNKALKKIDPQVEVTDEHGNKSRINPITRNVYDSCDNVIALIDANGHITLHQRDNDGTTLKTIAADGVYKQFILDIFGRTTIIRDPLNHGTQHQHDRCNREVQRIDARQWGNGFTYNELGDRLSATNGNNETERYDYLHPCRQPTHHYLPGGDQYLTLNDYNRIGIIISEQLPDKRRNTWKTDVFGNVIEHTDLGGAHYIHKLNPFNPTEVVEVTSSGGTHGERRLVDGTLKPMPQQKLLYQYDEASHPLAILDEALSLTTRYRYDGASRRSRETFIAADGHIHQAVLMEWNALDWLVEVQDTIMQVKYSQDPNGNRRSTIASVFWDNAWQLLGYESWYTYTSANSMVINRGLLTKEGIQIVPGQGTMLLYDVAGRRNHEITINANGTRVDKSLFYFDNNLLSETSDTEGAQRTVAYDGKVARRKIYSTKDTEQISDYTSNSWLEGEHFRDEAQNINSTTHYDLSLTGMPTHQSTQVRNKQGSDGYDDSVDTEYVQFDNDKISLVRGTRQRMGGERTQSNVKNYYDPNSNIEFVVADNAKIRRFLTNSNNRIILKTENLDGKEFYFYTTLGQELARFGNIPPGFRFKVDKPTFANFDLNYHPVDEHFPLSAPSSCLVMAGDSFASISERMYGDESFADLIADNNGFRKEDKPPVGLTLNIPNLVNTNIHNWEGIYPVYNPTAIIGSLYPNMPMPQRRVMDNSRHRSKGKFWHVLVEAIVGTAIMAFAPEIAGVFGGVMNKILGEALGFALAGAASNLAQQELAIGFGDQKGLSFNAIGQSAVLSMGTAGIAKGIGLDLMKSPGSTGLLEAATKNIELTIATQALSFATGQQRHFDWRVMLASVANTLANVGTKQFDIGAPGFNDAVATTSASVASIGIDKLFGMEVSSETIAANTLGTYIGNQLAAQAKQHFAEFQAKKSSTAQTGTKIPTIHQELEESERQFIKSVLDHPHAHGNAPASTSRPGHHSTVNKHATNAHHLPRPGAHKKPPQQHLQNERAREEEILGRKSHNSKLHASRHRFWSMQDQPNHELTSSKKLSDDSSAWDLLGLSTTVSDLISPIKNVSKMKSGLGLFRTRHASPGKFDVDYDALLAKKGSPYRKIAKHSHYYDSPGSPISGDASRELQIQSIDAIITAAQKAHLSLRDTAHVLAIARHESGFNPYAAAGTTSAVGLGQFTRRTWRDHKLSYSKIWDLETQARALVTHFNDCKSRVKEFHLAEVYTHKFHHDGLGSYGRKGDGLNTSKREIYPKIDPISESIGNIF